MKVKIKKLYPGAIVPEYKTKDAAGMDLHAHLGDAQECKLPPGAIVLINTGIAIEIPGGFEGQVRPRSGIVSKKGLTVANSPGTIDCDYRGQIRVLLQNVTNETQTIEHGERIAQIVFAPVHRSEIELVNELSKTDRGHGGFGSTGTK